MEKNWVNLLQMVQFEFPTDNTPEGKVLSSYNAISALDVECAFASGYYLMGTVGLSYATNAHRDANDERERRH